MPTKWLWNPCLDVQHQGQCEDYAANRPDCQMITNWGQYQRGDELLIAGHGDGDDPTTMSGTGANGTDYEVDYNWLAKAIAGKQALYNAWGRIDKSLQLIIKLYMCTAADRKRVPGSNDKTKARFGGMLLAALIWEGYGKVKIAAYHGEITWAQGLQHKVVCTRKVAPDTLQVKDQKKVLGMPVVTRAGYSAARYHREWFTTNHFNMRWI